MSARILRFYKKVRLVLPFLLLLPVFSCNMNKQVKMDLIVYDHFLNPVKEFEGMRNKIIGSGLSDSVNIVGFSVYDESIKIVPDTNKSTALDIALSDLNFDEIIAGSENIDDIMNSIVMNRSGLSVPLAAFAEIRAYAEPYKPSIFKPIPESFEYKGIKAVKLEIYLIKKNKRKLIEMIQNDIISFNESAFEIVIE